MNGFERHRRSGCMIAALSGFEADLLRSLASQMVEICCATRGRFPTEVPRTRSRS